MKRDSGRLREAALRRASFVQSGNTIMHVSKRRHSTKNKGNQSVEEKS